MDSLFEGYGNKIGGILHLSPKESYELCAKGAILLDVRPESLASYKSFNVPNYLYCYHKEIEGNIKNLPKDTPIIVADAVGLRSKEVVEFLIKKGVTQVANMAGGITDWEKDGLPLIVDNKQRLTGSCMCQLRAWGKNKE
jgi:rhodanese-related sulfurtransferase